jgi:predicted PurR-regulated permease PerM
MMHQDSHEDRVFLSRALESFIRIGLIALLVAWCFEIVRPFIIPFAWAVIITIGLRPGHLWLTHRLNGRRVLAAVVISVLCFMLLLVPTLMLGISLVGEVDQVIAAFGHESLKIPPIPDALAQIPIIGDDISRLWATATTDFKALLVAAEPMLKTGLHWLVGMASGAGLGALHILVAILMTGFLLAQAEAGQRNVHQLAERLAGARGVELAGLAEATIRSVTRGILGVALIQSLLAGLGWLAVGVPAAGLWALLALVMGVVQIGIVPLSLPILVYVFFNVDTLTFLVFLVWSLFVGSLDNILKPMLLGRGVDVPMAVIFVGAIGGFLSSGIIGLFVGAVVLVLGYKLFLAWLHTAPEDSDRAGASAPAQDPPQHV